MGFLQILLNSVFHLINIWDGEREISRKKNNNITF